MSDKPADAAAPPKKKGKMKLIVMAVAFLALIGGGVGAGIYATKAGMVGGGAEAKEHEPAGPKLVPKSEQKRPGEGGEGGEGGHGGGGEKAEASHGGKPTPAGEGGEK